MTRHNRIRKYTATSAALWLVALSALSAVGTAYAHHFVYVAQDASRISTARAGLARSPVTTLG